MLYLDSLVLHNFKSFRHASIKFKSNFNCIVGPNGSGKSNICDSLLFVLGESSMKRMRVSSMSQLINDRAKPMDEDGTRRAYVKLNFSGGESLEVARVIKSNNKVGYRLDGKHVTRQEMLDVLRARKSEISEVNTITQGEITTMLSLNPRERRELIEVAAGISEFNEKKTASMKELEKVEARINEARVLLNERQGFLQDLEKEKEDAERYIALANTIKRINYTLLKVREESIARELSAAVASLQGKEKQHADLARRVAEVDLETENRLAKKSELAKKLNERSLEVSAISRQLEEINKALAVSESQRASSSARAEEMKAHLSQLLSGRKRLEEQLAANERALSESRAELSSLEKRLEGKDAAGSAGEFALLGRYEGNQRAIDSLLAEQRSQNDALIQHRLNAEITEKGIALARAASQQGREHAESAKQALSGKRSRLSELREKAAGSRSLLEKALKEIASVRGSTDALYAESVDVRERIAQMGARTDRSADVLKRSLKGFRGRAYELCSYDAKYASAVNAAASGRFGYFIVDSIDVAKEAIAIMKSKGLGRATFIPIREVVAAPTPKERGLVPVLEHVSFEEGLERAFAYIFANTYLVGSIDEAKGNGIGSHRFVTLEGELVEASGVVTGGSAEGLGIAALNAKLKGIEESRSNLGARMKELSASAESARKAVAVHEAEALNLEIEIKYADADAAKSAEEIRCAASALALHEKELEGLRSSIASLEEKSSDLEARISALKKENERVYADANAPGKRDSKVDRREAEAIKSSRARAEELRVGIATVSKESELLGGRLKEMEAESKKGNDELKALISTLSKLDSGMASDKESQSELRQKIEGHDAKSASLYKEVQDADSGIAQLSQEKGRISSELERLNRDSMELESRRSQLQTRIADINAELVAYPGVDMLDEHSTERLDARLAISKSEQEKLGMVNLKATEIYEQKKRDVDESREKLGILENERSSIIAMINEIETKKLDVFVETLNVVNENFKKLYNYVFDNQAYLYLEAPKDPFNSGLLVHLSNKLKAANSDLLSGGEKALLMLMLIFAIHMRSPRSFYIFDEIDTMLDKENSKKLSRLLSELSKKSQMIVVSHNDTLITAADTAIGVVHRDGESQVVGLQLAEPDIRNS